MKKFKILALAGSLAVLAGLASCVGIPEGATAVQNFNADRYLGKWYEIARFDFRFERDLDNTTAQYSKNPDGSIKVLNKGYNYVKNEWKSAEGVAKFVGDPTEARLKVSFFGPFYGGYNVIELDDDYKYALVAGNSLKYLWILSRTKTIPADVKQKYLEKAKSLGYDTEKLLWPKHDKN